MDKLLLLIKVIIGMLSWKTVLDIFLITTLIFLIYRTFRTLGTWRVLLGILIAVTFFLIASLFELEGISWIYSNLSQVAVLGVIVIFQPEIRKVFERAASLRRSEAGGSGTDLSLLISDAVFALSQQKRGAIIVCPGKETVKPWLTGGFPLDAAPSIPLIMSIFDPNSPGHDGALIIENGKFAMFGMRLPISETNSLSSDFGTRHHAAMGLSEVTDALIVVVSEERGTVKTFSRGRIKTAGDKNELSTRIESHWTKASSYIPIEALKKHKRKLPAEIGLSALLALIFWATLATSYARIFERSVVIPVEYTAIPQNLVLVGNKPTEIKLQVAGSKPDLEALNAARLSVKIDLANAMAGKQTLAVSEESIKLPKKVRILEMQPASLSIVLEEILQKELTVKPQLVGRLPRGVKLVSIDVNPPTVPALVPIGVDKKGEMSLMTTPIYLESIKEDAVLFCKIIGTADIHPAEKRWPDVQVHIKARGKAEP